MSGKWSWRGCASVSKAPAKPSFSITWRCAFMAQPKRQNRSAQSQTTRGDFMTSEEAQEGRSQEASHDLIRDSVDLALRIGNVLESLGCDYFVGGSLASSMFGEPRSTNDIDFVVAMRPQRVAAFAEKLGTDFEVDTAMLRDALARGSCANFFYLPLVIKIDFFALGTSPYDEMEFQRRQRVCVRSMQETLYVKAPEDTVLRKLLWYRAGGEESSKQWRDVVEVLRLSAPVLDNHYLSRWAIELGVDDLLRRAQSDSRR